MLKQPGNYFQQEKHVPYRSNWNMISIYIREYESDLRSNEHYLSRSEKKAWKKIQACTGFEV